MACAPAFGHALAHGALARLGAARGHAVRSAATAAFSPGARRIRALLASSTASAALLVVIAAGHAR
jgi:hypothetical protein